MVRFLKPGKVVILLKGRYAGKKAVIIKNTDDGTKSRPYGHALVVGLSRVPRKVTRNQPHRLQNKKARVKAFIKIINHNHIMPTRYNLEVEELKSFVTADLLVDVSQREERRKECKKILQEKLKSGKNMWFFTKLRF